MAWTATGDGGDGATAGTKGAGGSIGSHTHGSPDPGCTGYSQPEDGSGSDGSVLGPETDGADGTDGGYTPSETLSYNPRITYMIGGAYTKRMRGKFIGDFET